MKILKPLLAAFVCTLFLLQSCSTSNDVVTGRRIQKRKYTKGFFHNKKADNFNISAKEKDESNLADEGTKKDSDPTISTDNETINNQVTTTRNEVVSESKKEQGLTEEVIKSKTEITKDDSGSEKVTGNSENELELVKDNPENSLKEDNTSNKETRESTVDNKNRLFPLKKKDDTRIILGLILALFIPPLGVYIALGKGSEFRKNLIIFLGGLALVIVGVILTAGIATTSTAGSGVGVAVIITFAAVALLFWALIHAIVVIVREL